MATIQVAAGAILLTTCLLPPEPSSSAPRIEFEVPGDTIRAAIGTTVDPNVRVTADGVPVTSPRLRFESDSPAVLTVDSAGVLRALARGVAKVRVALITGAAEEEPDTTLMARVIIARLTRGIVKSCGSGS